MITLQNKDIIAKIDEQGAELKSIVLRSTNQEYMWSGDATYWGKTSPVLFPIVGSLVENTYYYKGVAYKLSRHGFAREKQFTANKISDTEVVLTLKYNEESLAVYPFKFKLALRYRLLANRLSCTYEVSNLGKSIMYFSVGGHPAFKVPLVMGTQYKDYYLQFSQPEVLVRHKLNNGLVSCQKEIINLKANNTFSDESADWILPLQPRLFYEDAIVLKKLASDSVVLGCDLHHHGLRFDFPGFPFLGIWAAKNAPFVCIEPWCGVADHVNHKQQLEHKEGIQPLGAHQKWNRTWSVTIY